MEGTVKTIVEARGFGFISAPGMSDTFFHCRDLSDDLEFSEQLVERRVKFEIESSDKGPRDEACGRHDGKRQQAGRRNERARANL